MPMVWYIYQSKSTMQFDRQKTYMVAEDLTVKIGDLGIYGTDYYRKRKAGREKSDIRMQSKNSVNISVKHRIELAIYKGISLFKC